MKVLLGYRMRLAAALQGGTSCSGRGCRAQPQIWAAAQSCLWIGKGPIPPGAERRLCHNPGHPRHHPGRAISFPFPCLEAPVPWSITAGDISGDTPHPPGCPGCHPRSRGGPGVTAGAGPRGPVRLLPPARRAAGADGRRQKLPMNNTRLMSAAPAAAAPHAPSAPATSAGGGPAVCLAPRGPAPHPGMCLVPINPAPHPTVCLAPINPAPHLGICLTPKGAAPLPAMSLAPMNPFP